MHTGLSLHVSSTPSSDSQLSAPMVGRMREARCKMASRYRRAIRTGLGSVLMYEVEEFSGSGGGYWEEGRTKGICIV